MKQVEKRDAVLTKEQQIERLTKPGSKVTFETLLNNCNKWNLSMEI